MEFQTSIESSRQEVSDIQLLRFLSYAGYSILIYEHLLTIPDEFRLMWSSRYSAVKTIFLFNRYWSLVYVGAATAHMGGLLYIDTRKFCFAFYISLSILNVICLGNLHVVMAIRTWAVFLKRRIIFVILSVLTLLCVVAVTTLLFFVLAHIGFDGFPLAPLYKTCITQPPDYTWAIWVPSITVETILFILMMSTIRPSSFNEEHHLLGRSPLIYSLYRDASIYYVLVLFSHLFYITVLNTSRERPIRNLFPAVFTLCLSYVAGQRLILSLRDFDQTTEDIRTLRLGGTEISAPRSVNENTLQFHVTSAFNGDTIGTRSFVPAGPERLP